MVKARASKGLLYPPVTSANQSAMRRQQWLDQASTAFVQPSEANRKIYRRLLEILWPSGHGIPGPHISEREIRRQHDEIRQNNGFPPYKDIFRRLRELQGDEGFTGIVKEGTNYQLQKLELSPKREPRQQLPKAEWIKIKQSFSNLCLHCGQQEPAVKLSPDHRIPRSRGGDNSIENLQPLCEQCNNQKSSACQGCDLNCQVCFWAYPETYKPIIISDENKEQIRREALALGVDQSALANKLLRDYFNSKRG